MRERGIIIDLLDLVAYVRRDARSQCRHHGPPPRTVRADVLLVDGDDLAGSTTSQFAAHLPGSADEVG
jgi:hypothetical protein